MGLRAEAQGTLIPAASTSGWHDTALTTQEFAAAVRVVLAKLGCTPDQLENIGAHSMKCTVLSWSAKANLPRHSRRLLGYHTAKGDKTMEIYSRDSMAGPLRDLDGLLMKIRSGSFLPDATRSGMMPTSTASGRGRMQCIRGRVFFELPFLALFYLINRVPL